MDLTTEIIKTARRPSASSHPFQRGVPGVTLTTTMDYLPVSHIPLEPQGTDEEGDIYRGEPPPPARSPPPPRARSPSSSSISSRSTSSTSSSSVFGGRLGAISTVVEQAIGRWARGWASTSSLASSSSTSSSSSFRTKTTRALSRRRRRRSSQADLQNARSEGAIRARRKIREASRHIPREFTLYIPPPFPSTTIAGAKSKDEEVLRTKSLAEVMARLSLALKDNAQSRFGHKPTSPPLATPAWSASSTPPLLYQDYMIPEDLQIKNFVAASARPDGLHRKGKKGKVKALRPGPSLSAPELAQVFLERNTSRAWWLDVASPTWDDMRQLGKLLQLHPLTLEDILQQDPREKLELFPKLGYYFISFHAIESRKTREERREAGGEASVGLQNEGIIEEVNVYLVVFREGIVSFHFADIAEHLQTVRNWVLALDQTVTMSSDWIAHGIIDSIVDHFFPFLDEIDREVREIESIVFDTASRVAKPEDAHLRASDTTLAPEISVDVDEKGTSLNFKEVDLLNRQPAKRKIRFALPKLPQHQFSLWYRIKYRVAFMYRQFRTMMNTLVVDKRVLNKTATTIHRITKARRLVTSLTRFLGSKSEVVSQIEKRLLKTGSGGLGNGISGDQDVFMYMEDVQDHILTLQQSLAHYERMLSQAHPTYLTELKLHASKTKDASDKSIVLLTVLSNVVLAGQILFSMFSMNINVPHNEEASHKYNVVGIVVSLNVLIWIVFGINVRRWWKQAERRRNGNSH